MMISYSESAWMNKRNKYDDNNNSNNNINFTNISPHLPSHCKHIWLRAEVLSRNPRGIDKDTQFVLDRRAPITPDDANKLINAGFKVTVESSASRVFSDESYLNNGCNIVSAGTWPNAPIDAVIIGLRDFAHADANKTTITHPILRHRHVFFAHVYKNQPGWQKSLSRFLRGGGVLLDFEYLVDDFGHRVTSYGEPAGYIGMATGILSWCRQQLSQKTVAPGVEVKVPKDLMNKLDGEEIPLVRHLKTLLSMASSITNRMPKILVIGANGRCGRGAIELGKKLEINELIQWNRKETRMNGPYKELLDYDVIVNAIRLDSSVQTPFLTHELLHNHDRHLSVLVDISCDTNAPNNPFPIYNATTTFDNPSLRILNNPPLDIIAIPNLPSLLPALSSTVFSAQLLPNLLSLSTYGWMTPVWRRCASLFTQKSMLLSPSTAASLHLAHEHAFVTSGVVALNRQGLYARSESPSLNQYHIYNASKNDQFNQYKLIRCLSVNGCGAFDENRMLQSIRGLMMRHEILRTIFVDNTNNNNNNNNNNKLNINIMINIPELHRMSQYVTISSNQWNEDLYHQLQNYNLNINTGQNFHIIIAPYNEADFVISVAFHPIIGDELSIEIFLRELIIAYHSGVYSLQSSVHCLQYTDFSSWETRQLNIMEKLKLVSENEIENASVMVDIHERELHKVLLFRQDLDYWRDILMHDFPITQLPTDYPRRNVQNNKRQIIRKHFSELLTKSILSITGHYNESKDIVPSTYSLSSLLTSIFIILLYRRVGEDDIVISSKYDGRYFYHFNNTIGPLQQQLLWRFNLDKNMSFIKLYEQINEHISLSKQHTFLPFIYLFNELWPNKNYNVMNSYINDTSKAQVEFLLSYALQNFVGENEISVPQLPNNISTQTWKSKECINSMDLTLLMDIDISNNIPKLVIEIQYDANLFSSHTINETIDQYILLNEQICQRFGDQHLSLSSIPKIDFPIMELSLVTNNASQGLPDVKAPLDDTWPGPITEKFNEQALLNKNSIAIVYKNEKITYEQLNILSNQLAISLIKSNIGAGDVIGLYGHRSPAVVCAIMGILKSGAAYSMMDPKYPSDRVITCMNVAKITGWLQCEATGNMEKDLIEYLNKLNLKFYEKLPPLNKLWKHRQKPLKAHRYLWQYNINDIKFPPITQETIAVVTFTSGSTGIPKGVMGRHVSLTHFYDWMSERFGLNQNDRFSMCSGIAHDPLQRDIFTPLYFGASIYIPTDEDIAEPGQLAIWMSKHHITVACLTPAMGQLLTSAVSGGEMNMDNDGQLPNLRCAFFVGDMLIKRDVYRLQSLSPKSVRVINMYGSTETQRAVGYLEIPPYIESSKNIENYQEIKGTSPPLSHLKEVIPVGVGMKDVDLLILNSSGILCGVHELGEIYVRSPHIARGYLGLDDVTAKKFLINPFTNKQISNDRMYRTGDLGRYTTNLGRVECCGRADDQVKIRGFRIELGEINAFLSKHPRVRENVTIVREDIPGQKQLVSYLTPLAFSDDEDDLDIKELIQSIREHLKEHLPNYMIPTSIIVLQAMPLTPNGKINRRALPPPSDIKQQQQQKEEKTEKTIHALTPIESRVMSIWEQLLNLDSIRVDDNFFDIGGHSLLATQLTLRLRQEFNNRVPMELLFRHPTVKTLSMALSNDNNINDNEKKTSINLEDEVKLDENINSSNATQPQRSISEYEGIFLTGATGFLGAFLLSKLLNYTNNNVKIYCSVRAATKEDAFQRLKDTMIAHMLWKDNYITRIIGVPSDLSKSNLGMSNDEFNQLGNVIDCIIHNGALVHWLLPYKKLKPVNVDGTIEIIRLAITGRLKSIHYVSTTSVFDSNYHQNLQQVSEDDPLTASIDGLNGGYPQSKWVAERILMLSRQRGINVSIYRPGYITGSSTHGVWNTDDFLCRLLKGCVQLQACPFETTTNNNNNNNNQEDKRMEVDMTPVDYVADMIVRLTLNDQVQNKGFNVVNPIPFRFYDVFKAINEFGYRMDMHNYIDWRQRLLETIENGQENALMPILSQFSPNWSDGLYHATYDMSNVCQGLQLDRQELAKTFPQLQKLITKYCSYLIACKFLPPPVVLNSKLIDDNDWSLIREGVTQQLTRTNRN